MAELDVKWPVEDMRKMSDQIRRAQLGLGKTLENSVTWAGILIAKSAAAATKKAPTKRRAYVNKGDNKFSKSAFPYFREIWRTGPDDTFRFYLKDSSNAYYQTIYNSGLAKDSWKWMVPGIKGNGTSNFASEVRKKNRSFEVVIEMHNKLPYITHALKRKDGDLLVNRAMEKAGNRMRHIIDRKLNK
jgi:hypothetical protein